MTKPTVETPSTRPAHAGPSLSGTVLNAVMVAAVAAALVWSALFVDLLRQRSDLGAAAPTAPAGQVADQTAQTPASVTTRTS
jgi:hypothetical protein